MIHTKKSKKISAVSLQQLSKHLKDMFQYHNYGIGTVLLIFSLLFLSVISSLQIENKNSVVYPAGEIAARDVVAQRDMLVEDTVATQSRRNRALSLQPMVFDIDKKATENFRKDCLDLLDDINKLGLSDSGLENVRIAFNEKHMSDISSSVFKILSASYVQAYMMETLIPWMENILSTGVIADMRQLSNSDNTAIVRDLDTGTEILLTQAGGLSDLRMVRASLGRKLRTEQDLNSRAKVALQEVLPLIVVPTLSLNQEITNQRNQEMLEAIVPVMYKVHQGEVIVREGDIVTHEQQLKLQALHRTSSGILDLPRFIGSMIIGFFLLLGLFITPSGSKGTVLRTRDQVLISLVLILFSCLAMAGINIVQHFDPSLTSRFMFAFPAAAGAGLTSLIFAARRYCAVGLLISYFTTLLFHADVSMFFFYFLSSMVTTWIILRAQNRQDVILGGLPLFITLIILGVAVALCENIKLEEYPFLLLALCINTFSCIFLVFAISPFLEMCMGYTTRFRLMELMNLEHPLLQQMMMELPGTYHHSLVVSNLVEAGAASVGANSLLCKVAALYHDIGKLSRPEYFVENQMGIENPHDKLSPSMSALILFAHVKEGVELAQEYRLGWEITDLIQQHHGTRPAMFFYNKALKLGEHPNIEEYSYPGPSPQTKEAAILLLADSIEASSRTLNNPTPAQLRGHIEKIVNGIYSEGQLNSSNLTFKDLSILSESFLRALVGQFHHRIEYPENVKQKDNVGAKSTVAEGNVSKKDTQELKEEWKVSDSQQTVNTKIPPDKTPSRQNGKPDSTDEQKK